MFYQLPLQSFVESNHASYLYSCHMQMSLKSEICLVFVFKFNEEGAELLNREKYF